MNISTTYHTSTVNLVETHKVNRIVNIEKIHIEKNVVNHIAIEKIQDVYNIQNRTIYQNTSNIGNHLNVSA